MTDDDARRSDGESVPMPPREMGAAAEELTAMFDVLASTRRRYVVYFLAENAEGPVSVAEIADYVRRVEPPDDVPETRRQERITIDLHHAHLPKLHEIGVVDYDDRTETVRYEGRRSFDDWVVRAHRSERE